MTLNPTLFRCFFQFSIGFLIRSTMFALLLFWTGQGPLVAQPKPADVPPLVKKRIDKVQTPVNDELLRELETDFFELLKTSKNVEELLKAESLLLDANDSSHWTNYSKASKILLTHRDLASIPLLLRYIVLHSKRSSCHIMIPEYQRVIEILSGKEFGKLYESGPEVESRMRSKVQQIVNEWWRTNKNKLVVAPDQMRPEQLHVLVTQALNAVSRAGDFNGSGGKRNTAYGSYHNIYYKVRRSSSEDEASFKPLHGAMLPLFLDKCGYRSDKAVEKPTSHDVFPYEFILILAEYVQNGQSELLKKILVDSSQSSTVRIVCALALVRGSHDFPTTTMIELLENESDLERKLICLLSLRWAGAQAVPVLLRYMDNENFEIATAAACALCDVKPKEAIPKFEKLLDRQHVEAPILLLNALAEYKTPAAKSLLKRLLSDAIEGTKNSQHLYRIITPFADVWGIERSRYNSDDRDYKRQASLLLTIANDKEVKQEAERKRQIAIVDSVQIQLETAKEIEALRRREYKRLLMLQSDEIISPKESEKAHQLLNASVAEVEEIQSKLMEQKAKLDSLMNDS